MQSRSFHLLGTAPQRLFHLLEGDSVVQTATEQLRDSGATRAEVEARGRVDGVRLRGTDGLSGAYEVMLLRGVVDGEGASLRFVGVDAGGQLRAGVLDDARAVSLELAMVFLVEERAKPSSQPVVPATWADVAAASVARAPEPTEEQPMPRIGDRVVHPTFGECAVEKMDDGDDFIFVRAKNQRLLRLSLDILQLELLDESDGRRRFAARVAKTGKGRP